MIPSRATAHEALETAHSMNPGPWREHSIHTAQAAERIAKACGMDGEKAYVLGLLHDIGRRTGIAQMRHVIDGYDYCMENGWNEVARICLTHSFPIQDIESDIAKIDVTPEQYEFIRAFLNGIEYDDYDRLIILCDSLANAEGFCILEKRFVDVSRRYGVFPSTIPRWNNTIRLKEYFDSLAGSSIYRLLPGIENCIYA